MTFIVSFVFTSTILIGCSKNEQLVDRDINVKKFLEFRVDSNSYEGMALIRPFLYAKECDASPNTYNFYLCKSATTGDTVLVFQPCSRIPLSEGDDDNLSVRFEDVERDTPSYIKINVPENFLFPPNAKYIFATLSVIKD